MKGVIQRKIEAYTAMIKKLGEESKSEHMILE